MHSLGVQLCGVAKSENVLRCCLKKYREKLGKTTIKVSENAQESCPDFANQENCSNVPLNQDNCSDLVSPMNIAKTAVQRLVTESRSQDMLLGASFSS